MLALPVDCLGDFGRRGLSVQYTQDSVGVRQHTQDVCGCLWLSVSTYKTSVAVRVCPCVSECVCGRLWPFPWTVRVILAPVGCLFSTHRTSVGVCGCPSAHTGRLCVSVSTHRTSVPVRVCPSAHIGRLWLFISAHISTLVLGLSTLTLPVDCSGDFGPRGLFVQYTLDVLHTGCPWVFASTHRTSVAVCGCPLAHTGRPWLSVCVRQHTQDVRGCPSADTGLHTGRPWVSASTRRTSVAVRVSNLVRQHTQNVCGCPSVHISALHTGTSVGVRQHHNMTSVAVRGWSVSTHRTSVAVCVCPSAHTRRPWVSVSRQQDVRCVCQNTQDMLGCPCVSVCVRQHTHDVRGCPSVHISALPTGRRGCPPAHAGRLWLFVDVRQHTHPRGLSVQYTQDVRGCPPSHTGRPWLSVAVRQHTQDVRGCLRLSISTHISTMVHGLSTLALPLDCSGDFGPRRLSVQYTQAVRGCPSAHTGRRPWLSISTHISTLVLGLNTLTLPVDCSGDFGPCGQSVQYTQDVCGCPPARTGRHTRRPWVSVSTHRTSVAVRVCLCVSVCFHQDTQDVRVCSSAHTGRVWLTVCIRVCPSAHTGRPGLSIKTHISTLVRGLSTLTLPMDCLGDFGPRGQSVQYTQDVRGCPPVHTGRPWLSVCVRVCLSVSVSTHRTAVALNQYTYQHVVPWTQHAGPSRGLFASFWPTWAVCSVHTGCPWVSASTHRTSIAVRGCPSAHTRRPWLSLCVRVCPVRTHKTSVGVCQHTHDVRVCQSAHTGRLWLSVCQSEHTDVRGCPPSHTGRPWLSVAVRQQTQDVRGCLRLSISTHISTMVHGLSTLALPLDCSGDFGPRRLSVQYTQAVRGCPSAHTGRPCVSVSTHRTSMAVRVCPSAYTGRSWLSISTHISTLVLGLNTLTLPVDCSGDFGPSGQSVQYTQDVRGCPPAHTGRPWLSEAFFQHTQDVRGCPYVPVCVCVCPSGHTRRPWVSVSTHRTSVAVRVCLCVSVCFHQDTQDVHVRSSAHTGRVWLIVCIRVCPSAHTGRPGLSIKTHISTLVLGLSTLTLPMDCLGDFGPRGQSVQYTQDVRGCPPAHTGRPWLSVCVRVCLSVSVSTHRTAVALNQYTYQHVGPWTQHAGPSRGLFASYWPTWAVCSVHTGCPWVSASTHRTSMAVRGCPSAHTRRPWLSLCVRVCPSAHTRRLWVSVSTHMTFVCISQHTQDHTHNVCVCPSAHMTSVAIHRPRGLSVQYTQDVRGCPPSHTGRPWLSSAVHQYTYQHDGPWTQHAGPSPGLFGLFSTHRTSVGVRQHAQDVRGCPRLSVNTHRMSVAVRVCPCVSVCVHQDTQDDTQDVRVCSSAHTGRVWLTVCIRVCPSAHTGRPGLSIKTHISTLVRGLSTLTLPMDCLGDFGPRGQSVQYTQDVRGCPPVHTGRPWLSVCVRVCLSVSVSTHRTAVALNQYTYQHVVPWTQHAGPSRGLFASFWPTWAVCSVHTGCPWVSASTHRTSIAVRGCPSAHTRRPWLSLCVRVCPVRTHKTSVGVCQHTHDVRVCQSAHTGRPWLSVCQSEHTYTQDVRGCPPAHTGRPWLSVAVRGCPSAHTGRPWLSAAVHQYTYQHDGPWTQHAGSSPGLFGTHRTSMAVRVSPSAYTGRSWLSISTHISTLVLGLNTLTLPVDCSGDFGPSGQSVQYTQDVRGCPPAHTGRPWLSEAFFQHTQDVRGCPYVPVCVCVCPSGHTRRPWVSVSTHRTSVAVRVCLCVSVCFHQDTQDVPVRSSAHTGRVWLIMCIRVCPSAHTGRPGLSIKTHISTLVLGLSTLTLPMDCLGDFGPRGQSVQYTQDVRGCPPAHTGRPWLSVCVRVCLSVSVSTHRTAVALNQYTYQHVGPWTQHAGPSRGLFASYWPTWAVCSVHTGCPWVSASTHRTSMAVCGCPSAHTRRPWLSLCVRVCPSAHTRRLWVSVSTHMTFVCISQHTQDHTHNVCVCPSAHMTSVAIHRPRGLSVQYTQDVRGCPPSHTGRLWLSVAVRQHTQDVRCCLRLSISTHISTMVHGLSTLALPLDCSGDFGPRSLSVQYTQAVRGCPSAHTGRPCVSVSTHRTSMAVRVCPSAYTGRPWLSISTHISTLVLGLNTLTLPVDCSGDFGPCGQSVQYTQDVRGCPPAHTGRPWLSVCVRVCLSVSVSTNRKAVALNQYTYQHVGPWTQHAGPSRVAVLVCPCVPSAHTRRLWVSVSTHMTFVCVSQHTQDVRGYLCVSLCVSQNTQDVRGCPSVHISTRWSLDSACWPSPWTVWVILADVGCLFSTHRCLWVSASTHRMCVAVLQHTQDVRGCLRLSISTHISTMVHGLSTLALPLDCSGDFGPRRLSVQYTQAVRGCPSAHTGHPCVFVSTHRTSMAVRVCPSAYTGRPWLSISTHISTLGLGLNTLTLPVDCSCDFGPCGQSVQYTQDVRGCPPAHTGRPWLSEAFRKHTQDVCGCPCVPVCVPVFPSGHTRRPCVFVSTHRTCVADRVYPCVSVSTHRTSGAVRQDTYQHVGSWTQHADPSHGLFG
ncbi:hypothetical protein IGI04_002071 [Brassica rapa subsp. trilocularis]|uniref:Uncharacterized protein n=1 Tax=Brassica rapa subsp. trilocularis TaxID=1813537 RepID=A0ABQ7NUK3_BRACM|nr:hypothetical protein IGI04_002071 [Brassica rapa subsp. trilocularis]